MQKYYRDKKNNFFEIFNTENRNYIRSGILDKNERDTGIDPFMRDFPSLIDVGIMGTCIHGKSGLCAKSGVQCYQNGLNQQGENMSFENFKKIVDECKDRCFSFALGGRGDVDQHEHFEEILAYCKENDIVPNFTSSGLGFSPEIVDICKKYCGAVAISQYSRLNTTPIFVSRKLSANEPRRVYKTINDIPTVFTLGDNNPDCTHKNGIYTINGLIFSYNSNYCFKENEPLDYELVRVFNEINAPSINNIQNYTNNAVKMLIDKGVKTNIHFVLGKNSIDEAILRLKYNGFQNGINAVIFLLHKPVGLGTEANVLDINDPRLKEFFSLIDSKKFPFKVGFDSCTIPAILNFTTHIDNNSIDSCEGGRFSMYITADMKAIPCSFDNQEMKWSYDIANDTIENAWNSKQFNDFRNHFHNSCNNCDKKHLCYGGCPIRREIVLCNNKDKDLK